MTVEAVVTVVPATNLRNARRGDVTTAFVLASDKGQHHGTIYVTAWSDIYLQAQRGDRSSVLWLASILAHEARHLDGDDENAAYTEQLCVLRALARRDGLDLSGVITQVEKAWRARR